jgi:hypothetical protein
MVVRTNETTKGNIMPVYRTKGVLTGTIEADNVAQAQEYLHEDDMAKYVSANADLEGVLEWIVWDLASDGHHWTVTAVTTRELSGDELKRLSSEVSGQNSDGLGESFEQQPFAEIDEEDTEEDCGVCGGSGAGPDAEPDEYCINCGGDGVVYRDAWGMISFDWESNDCAFERVK